MEWKTKVLSYKLEEGGFRVKVEIDGSKWNGYYYKGKAIQYTLSVYGYGGKEQAETLAPAILGVLANADEMDRLRQENEELKKRLKSVAAQHGVSLATAFGELSVT